MSGMNKAPVYLF